MFDVRAALSGLNGQVFETGSDLRRSLADVTREHVKELPIEFGPADLVMLVQKKDWLRRTEQGLKLVLR